MLHRKTINVLFLFSFLLFSLTSFAKNYYLSSSSGNDSNSGIDESNAWRSINKLNNTRLYPGDNVYFKRGDTFYGTIMITNAGSSSSPITYSAYGSGSKPIITGFSTVSSWTNVGGNIWESNQSVSSLPYTNIVVINNTNTPMGRYPNSDYLIVESHSGNSSITSSSLSGSNWTGAEVVIKKKRWVTETGKITGQSGSTLYYTDNKLYVPTDKYGFFIQNDNRTLDKQNEWYYNSSTKKLRIYSTYQPYNVQVSTLENLVYADWGANGDYFRIQDLAFKGSNSGALVIKNKRNVAIKNCDITFSGAEGIFADNSPYMEVSSNNIKYLNGNAIRLTSSSYNGSVVSNNISNADMIAGMGKSYSFGAIGIGGDNTIVQYNNIDSSGYNGIKFNGNNVKIKNNFINHSCIVFDDGGGIYTDKKEYGREITGNIVLNTVGNTNGSGTSDLLAHGIFLDHGASDVLISGNTVAGCNGAGIFIHSTASITITGNTAYNNGKKGNWLRGGMMFQSDDLTALRNVNLNKNIFFAKTADQVALFSYSSSQNVDEIKLLGTADYNYYARPINNKDFISIQGSGIPWPGHYYDVNSWKAYFGQDSHAGGAPKTISSEDELRFEFNASTSARTISLDANYLDVKGNSYNGSITLQPYTSAILIRNGASTVTPIAADAGDNQTITLPTNSAKLTGSGSGPITSYQWRQVSGPSNVMSSVDNASASVTNLVKGVYQFELKVSSSNDSKRDTVQVTVNPEQTIVAAITANAGEDQTITLPSNSVKLSGSGSGPITSYQWRQLSGPSTVMSSVDNASTTVTELIKGVYQFELKVLSSNTGKRDTVQVTVNSAPTVAAPVSPVTANAGSDQTITLPTNSVKLSGSGSGTISSYQWRQISGPSNVMSSVDNASTSVSNLIQGVYEFELKVQGSSQTVRDTVEVTVNSKVQVNEVYSNLSVNAGKDQTIFLPNNVVKLSGNGTGPITAYQWRQLDGPISVISSINSANAEVDNLVEGNYTFELKVLADGDISKRDTMKVIVSAEPLTANAGNDQRITLPNNSVNLSGSGSGPITFYQWRQLNGPSKVMSSIDNAAATVDNLVEGVYQFELKVMSSGSVSQRDTIEVTVVYPPLSANAGADQEITLPTNSVKLLGSGAGAISAYQWRQLSGPSIVMSSVDYASTPVNGLIQGKYEFELKVLDTVKNISVRDTMQVVVNVSNTTYASKTMTTTSTSSLDATLEDKQAFESLTAPSQQKTVAPASTDLKIYPNPVEDITTLQINITEPNSNVVIQISDMKGTLVYKKQLTAGVGLLTENINMSNYTSGTYIITVITNSVERQTIQALKL